MWSNGDNGASLLVSPSVAQVPVEVDVVIPDMRSAPAVVNGHWINQGPGTQKPNETTQNPHKDGLFTEVNEIRGLCAHPVNLQRVLDQKTSLEII